ncbi:MAG TPA: efflux RND transporter permease subunit [Solirubrobacteraceae bacterium]
MTAIVRASLRFRLLVIAVAAGVLAVGTAQLRDAPVDVLPEFTPPYVEIQTEALGLSATEVENLITVPLEADLLNGVEDVDVIRSESLPGLSSIVLVFKPGTEIYRARQLVQERLAHAHALPRVSRPPTLLQPLSSSSRVLMIGVSSDRVSPIEKSVIARWTMRPRLMGVPGVANVAIWGMREQQIQVQVDPERLRERNVTLDQVVATAGNAQIVSPLSFLQASTPGSGGFIETPQQRLQVRNVLERLADPDELGKVPVEETRGRLRLSDVSDIKVDHQPLIGDAVVDDGQGLLLVVEKFPGADTAAVTRGVERALETLKPGLSGMRTDTSIFRPATFIEEAIDNLALALVIAGAVVALALAALLFRWRTVLVALVAIPVSLVAAALVLDVLGETFNAISFAGLAAALALVVDDAVVGSANVARRLRGQGGAGSPASAVLQATQEVRRPLLYATLITLLAVAPIVVMQGRPGAFFEPLVLSYALAVTAAMVVAMTVTPALSLLLFSAGSPRHGESPLLARLRPFYAAALARFMRRPKTPLIAAVACLLAGLAVLPLLSTSLIPSFNDRNVVVHLEGEPGTSSGRMTTVATELSRELRALPGVDNVGAHVGRAIGGDQRVDVNSSEVWASIESGADHDATVRRIRAAAARVPGVDADVSSNATQEIRDAGALVRGDNPASGDGLSVLTGSGRPLVARVYGHDLDLLRTEAEKVRAAMARVDGVGDLRVEVSRQQPNLVIEVDLAKARREGIKPGDVRRAEASLLQGIHVGSVFEEQKVFDVLVVGVPATRRSVADVRNLLIDRPDGGQVRLGQVADVRIEQTPVAIDREAVSRHLDVSAGVRGRPLDDVARDVRAELAGLSFPLEYHVEVLAQTTNDEIGAAGMLAVALVAAVAAFLLFQAAFRSWRVAAMAFLLLPVSLAGGLLAALIGGAELSLGSLVGLLALFGVAARTSLLSVRHLQDSDEAEGARFGEPLIVSGAQERLGPIMTTAAALGLLALPFVVLGSRAGLEIMHPMAVVLLGGVVSTTFVSLFVLPALYLRVGGVPRSDLEWRDVLVTQFKGIESAGDPGGAAVPVQGNGDPLSAGDVPAPDVEAHESER